MALQFGGFRSPSPQIDGFRPPTAAAARPGVSPEEFVHALDRHAALAHCGGAAFHRTGAHVACSKDSWPTRLQLPRQTAHPFPGRRVDDFVTGFDHALFITLDLSLHPSSAWLD